MSEMACFWDESDLSTSISKADTLTNVNLALKQHKMQLVNRQWLPHKFWSQVILANRTAHSMIGSWASVSL